MSLSVLVDHTVQWKAPAPPNIACSCLRRGNHPDHQDLVAAATGFNAGRGDSSLWRVFLSSPVSTPSRPPAVRNRNLRPPTPHGSSSSGGNRDLLLPVTLGVALLLFLLRAAIRGC